MGKHVFKLPDVGEGIVEGEIVDWKVKAGDSVTEDQPIVDLMTDKATVAIPSPVSGKVISTTGKPGDMVAVGAELIVFEVEGKGKENIRDSVIGRSTIDTKGDGVMGSSYDDWTVHQLKWALNERGLPVSGKKRELIERLHLLRPEKKEKSSRRKNYLEEGVLDAGDAELVGQIKAKYRAPDYRPPESKDGEYTKISYAMIALSLSIVTALYFFLIEEHVIDVLKLTVSVAPVGGILAVITAGWLVLYIRQEIKKTEPIVSIHEVPGAWYVIMAIGLLTVCGFWWAVLSGSSGRWILFYFLNVGSFVIPFLLLGPLGSVDEMEVKLERKMALRNKLTQEHYIAWEDAQKHEEHNQFDAATRIWSELGEEGEVERVTRLKTECLCVVLKRKIKDLTELGADCTQLEEQLAVIETALAESASSKSSIGTESEE
jgi:hypothetical protein